MSNVYVFQAALLCEACGIAAQSGRAPAGDSDSYPQGPYPDGGGEADCPQHCDHCRAFLENPLTSDGETYVREKVLRGEGNPAVLETWWAFYGESLS